MHCFPNEGKMGFWTGKAVEGKSVLATLQSCLALSPYPVLELVLGLAVEGGDEGCSKAGGRIFDYLILILCLLPMDDRLSKAQ